MNKTIEKILESWGSTSLPCEYDSSGIFTTLKGLEDQLLHEPSIIVALVPDGEGGVVHQTFDVEYD